MPDLLRSTLAKNGAQSTTAYRATVKITAAGTQAIIPAMGQDYVITPEVVIGSPVEGGPALIIYDELSRPWMIVSAAAAAQTMAMTQAIGDGSSRTFVVSHNLGTKLVDVSVRQAASPYAEVDAEVEYTSNDTITVRTSPALAAPTVGQYNVVVISGVGNAGPAGPAGGQSYSTTIGDGSSKTFTVTHNLNTFNAQVTVYTTASPRTEVTAEVERTDANTITVKTRTADPAPTAGQYTVVVNGPGPAITQQTIDPWHLVGAAGEAAFGTGWANYGGAFQSAAYRKMPDGTVQLKGLIAAAAGVQANMFTLPVGYRPSATSIQDTIADGAQSRIDILSTGIVQRAGGTNGYVSLEGIRFIAEDVPVTTLPAGPPGPTGPPGPATGTAIPTVSTLPTVGLTDGYEVYYQNAAMATDGVRWHLVYNAASANASKWECVGGSPLIAEAMASASLAGHTGGTWGGINPLPTVTLPLAGTYDTEQIASWQNASGGGTIVSGLRVAGVDPGSGEYAQDQLASVGSWLSLAHRRRLVNRAAGDSVFIVQQPSVTGTITRLGAQLAIWPVRVG